MIKTIDLQIEAFKKADEKLKELVEKKEILSEKLYKHEEKQIEEQLNQELKQIEKEYPIKKEIEKFLKQN